MQNKPFKTVKLLMSLMLLSPSSPVFALDSNSPESFKPVEKNLELINYQKNSIMLAEAAKKKPEKEKPKKTSETSKDKKDSKETKEAESKESKDSKDKEAKNFKEPVITNVVEVTTAKLVDNPKEFLGKNIRFQSEFFAFSNLALDYKPALRPHKTHISLLVYRPKSKIPFSELKLAMKMPEEKDPKSKLLTSLHDGDTIEVTGNVFSTALDEPWVDVLNLKVVARKKEKDKDKKASK